MNSTLQLDSASSWNSAHRTGAGLRETETAGKLAQVATLLDDRVLDLGRLVDTIHSVPELAYRVRRAAGYEFAGNSTLAEAVVLAGRDVLRTVVASFAELHSSANRRESARALVCFPRRRAY